MIDTVLTIDEIFIRMAETDAALPIDDAVEELTAFELGDFRLVADGKRLRIEPFQGTPAERQIVAEHNWPLAAARKGRMATDGMERTLAHFKKIGK
jgi:hypothetical protein